MFTLKFVFLLETFIVLVTASPVDQFDYYEPQDVSISGNDAVLFRQARSPQGGSIDMGYGKGPNGREASVQYNHKIYTSIDGRGSIDAYAQGTRNYDFNRNNYGGGVQGRRRF